MKTWWPFILRVRAERELAECQKAHREAAAKLEKCRVELRRCKARK